MAKSRKPRKIEGLKWAAIAPRNPFPGPKKLSGSAAAGIAFQNKLGRYLARQIDLRRLEGKLYSDLWIMFKDRNGEGFAQPDHFLLQPTRIVLIECKLTQNDAAWPQLYGLYKPLVEHLFKRPAICVQAFRRMRVEEPDRPKISIYSEAGLDFKDGAIWPFFL